MADSGDPIPNDYIIKSHTDAKWYLGVADELTPKLPIDLEVERLDDRGLLVADNNGVRAARHAVYDAVVAAFDGPAYARVQRELRKTTPSYLGGIAKRVDKILTAYEEIYSSLSGSNIGVAMRHLEEEFASALPPSKKDGAIQTYQKSMRDFQSFQETLYNFRKLLELGTHVVRAKPGRPKLATFYFVESLAMDWVKMTGNPPTRIYDVINSVEAGDFFRFCLASANTVRGLVEFGSFDSAVRKVCEAWHPKSSKPDF